MSFWILGAIWAAINMIQSHAYVFTNLHSVLNTLLSIATCQKVHKLEYLTSFLVTIACVMILFDPSAKRVGE